ncbi:MAG: TRAP transporter fused permease subunit [Desulfuromonadales bacterium]|nr:TRAP transporter fused permease subunit [Desulfuromonadales bacterium]
MIDSKQPETVSGGQRVTRILVTLLASVLTLGAVAWGADLYRRIGLEIYNEQFLAVMLTIALSLAFLNLPARKGAPRGRVAWYDLVAAVAVWVAGGYLAIHYPNLVDLILLRPPDAVAVGCVLILLTLEALRRSIGKVLVIIVSVFLLYGLFGNLVPGQLAGRAQDWQRLAAYLSFDVNGMLGTPLFVAATVVIAFILFGSLLTLTGGSDFFTELALITMGRFRGGSAKIAVVASGFFGSISGSAVANVAATGIITIPMIKRAGYPGHHAGAIEAVASTGGQLMPPVMGASAFLMAEFLQIPYGKVVMAALIPALLYYAALFIQVDLEAGKAGITRVPAKEIPRLRAVLSGWHFILPFVVLVGGLFYLRLQAEAAALLACATLLGGAFIFGYKGKRPALGAVLQSLRTTGLSMVELILICAGAGMVIGVIAVSGIGFGLSLALVRLGGGYLPLLLLLSAAVCIVLGMGLPTVGVYVLLAALVAPALVEVGVVPIAAHLFVMYFGMMSMITPPVALAAYAAAGIAGADFWKTTVAAMRIGWAAFVLPFLFVAAPCLILIGEPKSIALAVTTAFLGIWFVSIGLVGYFQRTLSTPLRVAFAVAGVLALIPAKAFPWAVWTDVLGAVVGLVLIANEILITRRPQRQAAKAAQHCKEVA